MSENFRRLQLEKLREGILEHQGEICQALRKDLNKSEFETYETGDGYGVGERDQLHAETPPQDDAAEAGRDS